MNLGPDSRAKIIILAVLAIVAFAGNSIIARYALGDGSIEPGAYSLIRLASGALILLPLASGLNARRDLPGALALVAYVGFFSWAYLSLAAGVGALILFSCVQATVMVLGIRKGERPGAMGIAGMALALGGLVVLVAPTGDEANGGAPLFPALLMAAAGVAWGLYTMLGRAADAATSYTARSFLLGTIIFLPLVFADAGWPSLNGVLLAVLSGAITSGLGYVVWNRVSPSLGIATVATVQLATPPAAALGGIALLGEAMTAEFAIASVLIIGGILLTLRKG